MNNSTKIFNRCILGAAILFASLIGFLTFASTPAKSAEFCVENTIDGLNAIQDAGYEYHDHIEGNMVSVWLEAFNTTGRPSNVEDDEIYIFYRKWDRLVLFFFPHEGKTCDFWKTSVKEFEEMKKKVAKKSRES